MTSKSEQLIQSGIEIILRAFDTQKEEFNEIMSDVKTRLDKVMLENQKLKEDNFICHKELNEVRHKNKKLEESLIQSQQTINMLKYSVFNEEKKLKEDNSMPHYNINNYLIANNNNIINNSTSSKEFIKNKSFSNGIKPKINDHSRNMKIEIHTNKSYLGFKPLSKTLECDKKKKKNLISLQKSQLIIDEQKLGNFLTECRKSLITKDFENLLLMFNLFKSREISSNEFIKECKEILSKDKMLKSLYSELLISN